MHNNTDFSNNHQHSHPESNSIFNKSIDEKNLPSSTEIIAQSTENTLPDELSPTIASPKRHSTASSSFYEPYSVFSKNEKMVIVLIASISCFFSPFSANIYFPALTLIQEDMHITERMVSTTVTVYMILQGISPSFWGSLADSWGRRPVYISTFMIYTLACIGLANTENYATLLSLRMLQAFGTSSAVAVGAGTIGDIASPIERGGYMGIYTMGSMLGSCLGPPLGGLLSYQLGWRWVFWVLAIMALGLWIVQIFCLPETLRSLVGNGTGYANPTPIQYWRHKKNQNKEKKTDQRQGIEEEMIEGSTVSTKSNQLSDQSCLSLSSDTTAGNHSNNNKGIDEKQTYVSNSDSGILKPDCINDLKINHQNQSDKKQWKFPNPFQSLTYLKEKDVAALLIYNSMQYASLYCVLTSLTSLFSDIYKLNVFQIGLCFLSGGLGATIGSFTSGKVLNWRFKKISNQMNLSEEYAKRAKIDPEFPIEKARMEITWIWGIIFNIFMVVYGWCLHQRVHIAIPLVINFILSYNSTCILNACNTLLVDCFPKNSAAIIAANNLTRCLLGAGAVMIVEPAISKMGVGWFFTMISSILFVSRISIVILLKFGPKWRLERLKRQQEAST
ncbi:major facilitator superfamily domain-containing protein [Choanephora cucurbitarum]|nr:major facilitator superfamily domain-containing protein [Choanephora cucurbitarum]